MKVLIYNSPILVYPSIKIGTFVLECVCKCPLRMLSVVFECVVCISVDIHNSPIQGLGVYPQTGGSLYKDSYFCDIMRIMGSHEVNAQEATLAGNRSGRAGGGERGCGGGV